MARSASAEYVLPARSPGRGGGFARRFNPASRAADSGFIFLQFCEFPVPSASRGFDRAMATVR